ncbi:hypothetical protein HDZ31DRAFT_42850 [Schizophyllum fasciatum]
MLQSSYAKDTPSGTVARSPNISQSQHIRSTPMSNAEVEASVADETIGRIRVTSTAAFVKNLLPVPKDIVDKVLKALKAGEQLAYDGQRWVDFPIDENATEAQLYPAFVKVASRISDALRELCPQKDDDERILFSQWYIYHTKAPQSANPGAPRTRPDCVLALEKLSGAKLQTAIWWLQIIVAVEVKRRDEDWQVTVLQLLKYLRQVLVEQQNRRFVFGFTLGPRQMFIWLHDRSGVLGTDVPINFHENPDVFVQAMASLLYLPAHELGFDPDMKIYLGPNTPPLAPYRMPFSPKDYMQSPYDTHWVIKLGGKSYVTARAVGLVRSGVLRGSGTIVWIVVEHDDNVTASKRKLFVIKQQWRRADVVSEADLYKMAGTSSDYVGKMIANEDAQINGKADSTLEVIRRGLGSSPQVTGKRERSPTLVDERREPREHIQCVQEGDIIRQLFGSRGGDVHNRIRTRILLSTVGHSVKFFADRRELAHTILDAVKGDQHLYNQGVLPSDISPGNILIRGLENGDSARGGCLIDLDRGKRRTTSIPPAGPDQQMSDMLLGLTEFAVQLRCPPRACIIDGTVDRECCSRAFRAIARWATKDIDRHKAATLAPDYLSDVIAYIQEFEGTPHGQKYTVQDLHWNLDLDSRPLFTRSASSSQEQADYSRSGTLPFISPELLAFEPKAVVPNTVKADIYPDAVHDIESFFWVLVYICTTRSGPGGRREEYTLKVDEIEDPQQRQEVQRLIRVTRSFFDTDDLATLYGNKAKLREEGLEDFDKHIIPCFHPYFSPFKHAMRSLFQLLQIALKYRGYEYCSIHDRAIGILQRLVDELQAPEYDEGDTKATKDELKKRKKFMADLRSSIDEVPGALSLATSPKAVKVQKQESYTGAPIPSFAPDAKKKRTKA